jgi:hypothetical protein
MELIKTNAKLEKELKEFEGIWKNELLEII